MIFMSSAYTPWVMRLGVREFGVCVWFGFLVWFGFSCLEFVGLSSVISYPCSPSSSHRSIGSMNRRNRAGDKLSPWATPVVIGMGSVFQLDPSKKVRAFV